MNSNLEIDELAARADPQPRRIRGAPNTTYASPGLPAHCHRNPPVSFAPRTANARVILRIAVGTLKVPFAAQKLACVFSCRRFAHGLATDDARFRWWDAWGETSSSRVHRIYAGITEFMKKLVARSLQLFHGL